MCNNDNRAQAAKTAAETYRQAACIAAEVKVLEVQAQPVPSIADRALSDAEVSRLKAEVDRLTNALAEVAGFDRRCADALADEVDVLVRKHVIDSRSPAADALIDYREPPTSPRSDRLLALEADLATARKDATNVRREALEEIVRHGQRVLDEGIEDGLRNHDRLTKELGQARAKLDEVRRRYLRWANADDDSDRVAVEVIDSLGDLFGDAELATDPPAEQGKDGC